jgi:NADH-quinone oxidoreductase subunit I
MTDVYEFSEFDRNNLIYNFATMMPHDVEGARTRLAAYEKDQAAKKAAAAKPAAAPSAPAVSEPPKKTPPASDNKV